MLTTTRNYPSTSEKFQPVRVEIDTPCEATGCDKRAEYGYLRAHGRLGLCLCGEHMPVEDLEYAVTHLMRRRTMDYQAITVDMENDAETFWEVIRETYPKIAEALERDGHAVVTSEVWTTLSELPGFSDGPAHATDALIDCGSEGSQWSDVVSSRHKVFDHAE